MDTPGNGSPPYFAFATDITAGHIRCRAVAAGPLSKLIAR